MVGNLKNKKHVYLVGTDRGGYAGYSFSKKDAKAFVKYRKGFVLKKIKNTEKVFENLNLNDEIIDFGYDVLMTGSEEEFFIESFNQYLTDTENELKLLSPLLSFLKCSEEEKHHVDDIRTFIKNYLSVVKLTDENDVDTITTWDLIDEVEAKRYFIKNVLDC